MLYLQMPFVLVMDYSVMTYMKTKKDLSRREAYWTEFITDFDFTMQHRPGSRLTLDFFKEVFRRLGMDVKFSTTYHPHTDGQMSCGTLLTTVKQPG